MTNEVKRSTGTGLNFGNDAVCTLKKELWRQRSDTATFLVIGLFSDFRNPMAKTQVTFLALDLIMPGEGSRIGRNANGCYCFNRKGEQEQ